MPSKPKPRGKDSPAKKATPSGAERGNKSRKQSGAGTSLYDLARKIQANHEALNKLGAGSALTDLARKIQANQEAISKLGAGSALTDLARKIQADQEAISKLGAGSALTDVARRIQANQEAISKLGAGSALTDVARQLRESQEAFRMPGAAIPSFLTEEEGRPSRSPPAVSKKNRKTAVPTTNRLLRHAAKGWAETEDGHRVIESLEKQQQTDLVVISADIRQSTSLMKEARDAYEFAAIMRSFTDESRAVTWKHDGLFDKFTGDGFLAYWPTSPENKNDVLQKALLAVQDYYSLFRKEAVPRLRANSQNYPSSAGLAVGIDEGLASVVAITDDPTIVGPAVVGAVRMSQSAQSWETWVNAHLGEHMLESQEDGSFADLDLVPVSFETKEYRHQDAYALRFLNLALPPA